MRKEKEITDGCMAAALPGEMTFVLLGRDPAAPMAILDWARHRVAIGKNKPDDLQIAEALQCAETMMRERESLRRSLRKVTV
jgi:hypothetical protein